MAGRHPGTRPMRAFWTLALPVLAGVPLSAQDFPVTGSLPPEARQFDFWVGAWDVNLRVRQDDGSWLDRHGAAARIYPILSGKAILELWSEDRQTGIKGFSLRYFDARRDEWVLWLNWPGSNRSGSSSLTGAFRHGRGEFFASRTDADGRETLSRYTFSDVTDHSLRWDDAYSTDGGLTWTHSWIMEFSRTAPRAFLSSEGGDAHTYHDGSRCDDTQFRAYELLAGQRTGVVEAGGQGSVTITGHRILDGCAVLTFAGPDGDPEGAWGFSHITWNTYTERYELMTLTSQASTPVRMFYSRDGGELTFYEDGVEDGSVDRFRIEALASGEVLWVHETPVDDGWQPVWQARLGPADSSGGRSPGS